MTSVPARDAAFASVSSAATPRKCGSPLLADDGDHAQNSGGDALDMAMDWSDDWRR